MRRCQRAAPLSLRRSSELVIRFWLTLITTASTTLGTSSFLLTPISSRAQVIAALGSRHRWPEVTKVPSGTHKQTNQERLGSETQAGRDFRSILLHRSLTGRMTEIISFPHTLDRTWIDPKGEANRSRKTLSDWRSMRKPWIRGFPTPLMLTRRPFRLFWPERPSRSRRGTNC